jgi:hypothetical protein
MKNPCAKYPVKTSLPKLLEKAQKVFNKFIRERDKNNGCISCGGPVEQAGHYFSQGHHSSLRYSEINTNGQCVKCNMYLSGNLIKYRQGLVKKYGADVVEKLELNADLRKAWKWTREELESIIKKYK